MNNALVYTSGKTAISLEWSFAHTVLLTLGFWINPSYNKHI